MSLPAPYYADESVVLYHGDAAEVWPQLTGEVDVLVLDPPFDEWRGVVPAGSARATVAFTTWQHREAVTARYGRPRAELIWAFGDGRWVSHELPRINHETILVFGETGSAYVGAQTNGLSVRKGTSSIGRDTLGARTYTPHERKSLDSVQFYPRNMGGAELGAWTKPLPLVARLLEWLGAPGAQVLDPYAGSGTTLVAAKTLGMRAVGIELEERTCEIAANRCRQDVLGLVVS